MILLEILMLLVILIPILKISMSLKRYKNKSTSPIIFIVMYLFFMINYDLSSYIDLYLVNLLVLISIAILSAINSKSNLTINIYYSSFLLALIVLWGSIYFFYFAMIVFTLLYLRNLDWRLWVTMILGFISSYSFVYFISWIFGDYFLDKYYNNVIPIEFSNYILFGMVFISVLTFIKLVFCSNKRSFIVFISWVFMFIGLCISLVRGLEDRTLLLYIYPLSVLIPYLFSIKIKTK